MKKILSVLLALMMVVSTVSFAAPAVVTTADYATDAAAEDAAEVTTEIEMAELAEASYDDADYGYLIFNIDFEKDAELNSWSGWSTVPSNTAAVTGQGEQVYRVATEYVDILQGKNARARFDINGGGDASQHVETDTDGNHYLVGTNYTQYPQPKLINNCSFTAGAGTYTLMVDSKLSNTTSAKIAPTGMTDPVMIGGSFAVSTEWTTYAAQFTTTDPSASIGSLAIYYTLSAANVTDVYFDNFKLYFKPSAVSITLDANTSNGAPSGAATETLTNVALTDGGVDLSSYVSSFTQNYDNFLGFSETAKGELLDSAELYYPKHNETLYAIWGYDVTMLPNDNSAMSQVVVEDIRCDEGITVGELVAKINNTTTRTLRGISLTADGEPLASDTVITADTSTLYMIWQADESVYGRLLWNVDLEREDSMGWAGTTIDVANTSVSAGAYICTIASYYHPAYENFNSRLRLVINETTVTDQKIVEENGNHYMTGTATTRYPQIDVTNFGGMKADGTYTLTFRLKSSKSGTLNLASPSGAIWADSYANVANEWDFVAIQCEVTGGSVNPQIKANFNFPETDVGNITISYDDVKLYYQPYETTTFDITVNKGTNSSAANAVVTVPADEPVAVSTLMAAMDGCIGIATTKDGAMLPADATITPDFNTTVYAVWGFDVTLNGGLNTEFSDVVVSGIDTRENITVGELVAKAKAANTTDRTVYGISTSAAGTMLSESTVVKAAGTYYVIWGFDVTLKAGQNTDFADVVVTDIDAINGTTIGALISEINNTTDREILGLSTTINGTVLDESTAVTKAGEYYIIWELEESEYGTLLLQIDFEKDGITAPTGNVKVTDIATYYNTDLVKGNVNFIAGSGSSTILNNVSLATENGNTYLTASTNTTGSGYNHIQINEWSNDVNWLSGTYTYVVDLKYDLPISGTAVHVNGLGAAQGADITILDNFGMTTVNVWDTVAFQYNGELSNESGIGNLYVAPKFASEGTIAVDNLRVYFKTEETIITLKPNGNTELEEFDMTVNTATGISVADVMAEIGKYETNRKLLGISKTSTGEPLAEDFVIKPAYQETYYILWDSAANHPERDAKLGKLLFLVDFERQEVIEANWNGISHELDNVLETNNSGGHVEDVATFYDPIFAGKNFRVRFNVVNNAAGAKIKDTADGNHYIEGVINHTSPQVGTNNFASMNFGNGIYTVFVDAIATNASYFKPTGMASTYGYTLIDGEQRTAGVDWTSTGEWQTYSYSMEVRDGANFGNAGAFFSSKVGETVAFDNYKIYYKPFTATITLLEGTLEGFGTHTVENISTTGENTGDDIVAAIQSELDIAGVEFVGLMDEYGDMIDLDEALIIPGDVTYTIVWGEENEYAPVTQEKNAIRYSTKVDSRGIRFVANLAADNAYNENTTEYGWIITRPELLEEAGVSPYAFTKDTVLSKSVIVGKNYGFQSTGDVDADRRHFEEDDTNVIITAVVYGLKPANYKSELLVRPYVVIDGETYYGKPWSRSMYDTAVAIKEGDDFESFDDTAKAYVQSIIDCTEFTA